MKPATLMYLTLAMLAFAGNSLLCRMALTGSDIDPAGFTAVRLISGALALFVVTQWRRIPSVSKGSGWGAVTLFVYAAGFSFAYVTMATGTGALILFGSVQLTMIIWGMLKGERFTRWQWFGLVLAVLGLVILLLPGLSAPPLFSALFMALAGVAWGVYSLLGKGVSQPLSMTAGNFILTIPLCAFLFLVLGDPLQLDHRGVLYAIVSGAVTSGLGYAIWYRVLPLLAATQAATVQLSVPVLAALMGWAFLAEAITTQMAVASVSILGGIALVIRSKKTAKS